MKKILLVTVVAIAIISCNNDSGRGNMTNTDSSVAPMNSTTTPGADPAAGDSLTRGAYQSGDTSSSRMTADSNKGKMDTSRTNP